MCRRARSWLAVVLLAPSLARAQTVDATAMTLLSGQQDPRDGTVHTVVPAIEDVWLTARDLDIPGVDKTKIVVSGWGEAVAGEPMDGDHLTGDLDLAYIEGQLFHGHLVITAGRQLLAAGVARNLQLDGLSLVAHLGSGLGVQAYGGAPVTPRFGTANGDAAAGARVFWHPGPSFEAGISFVDVLSDGQTERQEAGIDARYLATKELTFTAFAAVSPVEERLAEATLAARWQPRTNLELTLQGGQTAPDLFVSLASIFSVFAEETRDEAGGSVFFEPRPRLRLWGEGFVIHDDSGTGGRGSVRATLGLDASNATVVGVESRILYVPANGYVQARVFATRRFLPGLVATLEGDAYSLRDEVNGDSFSITGAATLGWAFCPGWHAVLTGIAGESPLVDWRLEAMAKLVYELDYRAAKEKP